METNKYFEEGMVLAERAWKENPNLSTNETIDLLRDIRFSVSINSASAEEHNGKMDGICSFFAEKGTEKIDIKNFNRDFSDLSKSTEYEGYIRMVDKLLPRIEDLSCEQGEAIEIPAKIRPHIKAESWGETINGVIGRIYLFNESYPPLYFPYCDVYSKIASDILVGERIPLLYSQVKTSEVLAAVQAVVDPEHSNNELSETIKKCLFYERKNESPLYNFLLSQGLTAISFYKNGGCPRYCDEVIGNVKNIFLDDGKVYADVEESSEEEYYECEITSTRRNYDWILDEIKKVVNITYGKDIIHQIPI